MKGKILVVDDERDLLQLLRDALELNDFEVLSADSAEAAEKLLPQQPDLILLDINMPGTDGIRFCSRIRDRVSCPIVFLTALSDSDDVLRGLEAGGDDYITKPFNVREFVGRVEAHLRRENRAGAVEKSGLYINYEGMSVRYDGREIPLTRSEFKIIELLSSYPGQVFDKERIYETVRGYDAEGDSAVITEHIRKIRGKFIKAGCDPYIETVWGVGYKWKK